MLYPSALVFLSIIFVSIVDHKDYQSDFIYGDAFVMITLALTLLHIVLMLVLSLTILLHNKAVRRKSILFSLLS